MSRQTSPFDSKTEEIRAIVDAIQLLTWLDYVEPRWRYGKAFDETRKLLADLLSERIGITNAPSGAELVDRMERTGVDLG